MDLNWEKESFSEFKWTLNSSAAAAAGKKWFEMDGCVEKEDELGGRQHHILRVRWGVTGSSKDIIFIYIYLS